MDHFRMTGNWLFYREKIQSVNYPFVFGGDFNFIRHDHVKSTDNVD
jgi:hypothetical protein